MLTLSISLLLNLGVSAGPLPSRAVSLWAADAACIRVHVPESGVRESSATGGRWTGRGSIAATSPLRRDLDDRGPAPGTGTGSGRVQSQGPALPSGAQPAIEASIRRGLDALAASQALLRDGSLPVGQEDAASPIGVTALAALAWMAGGSTPSRGPHAGALVRALEYLLSHQAGTGEAHPGWISATEDKASRSHGHGLATLAFSQAAALSPRSPLGRRLGEGLEAAVRHIERMQGSQGGWYYGPGRTAEHEGSVTVCLVQALRGARNTGVRVDGAVIQRAIGYVESLQDETGGFRYPRPAGVRRAHGRVPLHPHASGVYDGRIVDAGYDYVFRELAALVRARTGAARARPQLPPLRALLPGAGLLAAPGPAALPALGRGRGPPDPRGPGGGRDVAGPAARWTRGRPAPGPLRGRVRHGDELPLPLGTRGAAADLPAMSVASGGCVRRLDATDGTRGGPTAPRTAGTMTS